MSNEDEYIRRLDRKPMGEGPSSPVTPVMQRDAVADGPCLCEGTVGIWLAELNNHIIVTMLDRSSAAGAPLRMRSYFLEMDGAVKDYRTFPLPVSVATAIERTTWSMNALVGAGKAQRSWEALRGGRDIAEYKELIASMPLIRDIYDLDEVR